MMSEYIKKIARNKKEVIFALILSLFISLLSTAKLISQFIHLPSGRIFIGMPHYYADYYYYLDQFYQGAHGRWTTLNNFTTENFSAAFMYFNNIFLGKIGGLFGLESFTTYNLTLIFLKLVYLLICYRYIRIFFPNNFRYRIISFLLFVFSTSFPMIGGENGTSLFVEPISIFRAKNTFFTRFANIPSIYVDNIIFLLLLIIANHYFSLIKSVYQKKDNRSTTLRLYRYIIPLDILTVFLTLSDPAKGLIFVAMFYVGLLFLASNFRIKRFLLNFLLPSFQILLVFILTTYYLKSSIDSVPVYANGVMWDFNEYVKQFNTSGVFSIVKSFGFLGIFTFLGFATTFFQKKNLNEKLVLVGLFLCFSGFVIPYFINICYVPGFRFILTSTFLFMAIISTEFFVLVKKTYGQKVIYALIAAYFLINSITIYNSFIEEIKPLKIPDYNYAYLDKEIYEGFIFLRNLAPKDAIVLANPSMTFDLLIPGLTGKKTFTGHFLLSYNNSQKTQLAREFYYSWTNPNMAHAFLAANRIKYIIVTKYSFTEHNNILIKPYPFLKPVYTNKMISIFTY